MKTKAVKIDAEAFDKKFDDGEDITEYLDLSTSRLIHQSPQRVNVDFPRWMVTALDGEATRLGVTRQAIIKVWIAEKIKSATG